MSATINPAIIDILGRLEMTPEERAAKTAADIKAADTNGDGTISLEEFKAYAKNLTPEEQTALFAKMDPDGDGQVSYADVQKVMADYTPTAGK
jgi:hypothetical protein